MEKIPSNMFKCDNCGLLLEKGWTDEEAKKEAEEIFGKPVDDWKDGFVFICDPCFNRINPRNHPNLVDHLKKLI